MAMAEAEIKQDVRLDDVITTVVMARVTDYFGFFVFAIASALVFPTVFFPFLDPVPGTLASFAVFSLAFLARPVAAAYWARGQDHRGPDAAWQLYRRDWLAARL
jgi:multisubunit Na+/H+ antiporter MnhG subunit